MKISTINTIEVSALCDNTCAYCPAPVQARWRRVGNMAMGVFQTTLNWVEYFSKQGTQLELNLHGIGEPTLNPNLVEMIRLARAATSGRINFNTNGNSMTPALAAACKDAGIASINVTGHKAESTMRAVKAIKGAGVECHVNQDFAVNPNNWGGQVEWTEGVDYKLWCHWLARGQVMVTWDGKVTPCCLDAKGEGVFATVNDDLPSLEVPAFGLCETCHHDRP